MSTELSPLFDGDEVLTPPELGVSEVAAPLPSTARISTHNPFAAASTTGKITTALPPSTNAAPPRAVFISSTVISPEHMRDDLMASQQTVRRLSRQLHLMQTQSAENHRIQSEMERTTTKERAEKAAMKETLELLTHRLREAERLQRSFESKLQDYHSMVNHLGASQQELKRALHHSESQRQRLNCELAAVRQSDTPPQSAAGPSNATHGSSHETPAAGAGAAAPLGIVASMASRFENGTAARKPCPPSAVASPARTNPAHSAVPLSFSPETDHDATPQMPSMTAAEQVELGMHDDIFADLVGFHEAEVWSQDIDPLGGSSPVPQTRGTRSKTSASKNTTRQRKSPRRRAPKVLGRSARHNQASKSKRIARKSSRKPSKRASANKENASVKAKTSHFATTLQKAIVRDEDVLHVHKAPRSITSTQKPRLKLNVNPHQDHVDAALNMIPVTQFTQPLIVNQVMAAQPAAVADKPAAQHTPQSQTPKESPGDSTSPKKSSNVLQEEKVPEETAQMKAAPQKRVSVQDELAELFSEDEISTDCEQQTPAMPSMEDHGGLVSMESPHRSGRALDIFARPLMYAVEETKHEDASDSDDKPTHTGLFSDMSTDQTVTVEGWSVDTQSSPLTLTKSQPIARKQNPLLMKSPPYMTDDAPKQRKKVYVPPQMPLRTASKPPCQQPAAVEKPSGPILAEKPGQPAVTTAGEPRSVQPAVAPAALSHPVKPAARVMEKPSEQSEPTPQTTERQALVEFETRTPISSKAGVSQATDVVVIEAVEVLLKPEGTVPQTPMDWPPHSSQQAKIPQTELILESPQCLPTRGMLQRDHDTHQSFYPLTPWKMEMLKQSVVPTDSARTTPTEGLWGKQVTAQASAAAVQPSEADKQQTASWARIRKFGAATQASSSRGMPKKPAQRLPRLETPWDAKLRRNVVRVKKRVQCLPASPPSDQESEPSPAQLEPATAPTHHTANSPAKDHAAVMTSSRQSRYEVAATTPEPPTPQVPSLGHTVVHESPLQGMTFAYTPDSWKNLQTFRQKVIVHTEQSHNGGLLSLTRRDTWTALPAPQAALSVPQRAVRGTSMLFPDPAAMSPVSQTGVVPFMTPRFTPLQPALISFHPAGEEQPEVNDTQLVVGGQEPQSTAHGRKTRGFRAWILRVLCCSSQ